MSNFVFPTLPGLAWDTTKTPGFSTIVHRAASGMETRAALRAYPLWTFGMQYTFLSSGARGTDLNTLMGFVLARQGSFDSFLFTDPTDNAVSAQQFGYGDGVTKTFQLVRSLGTFVEPTQNINGVPAIYKTHLGVRSQLTQGIDYAVSSTGLVTMTVEPASGDVLDWTGGFYYRCRFDRDEHEFSQFLKDLWDLKKITFVGSPMNKV